MKFKSRTFYFSNYNCSTLWVVSLLSKRVSCYIITKVGESATPGMKRRKGEPWTQSTIIHHSLKTLDLLILMLPGVSKRSSKQIYYILKITKSWKGMDYSPNLLLEWMRVVKGSRNFWVCGRIPMMWTFKWNLSSSLWE